MMINFKIFKFGLIKKKINTEREIEMQISVRDWNRTRSNFGGKLCKINMIKRAQMEPFARYFILIKQSFTIFVFDRSRATKIDPDIIRNRFSQHPKTNMENFNQNKHSSRPKIQNRKQNLFLKQNSVCMCVCSYGDASDANKPRLLPALGEQSSVRDSSLSCVCAHACFQY